MLVVLIDITSVTKYSGKDKKRLIVDMKKLGEMYLKWKILIKEEVFWYKKQKFAKKCWQWKKKTI